MVIPTLLRDHNRQFLEIPKNSKLLRLGLFAYVGKVGNSQKTGNSFRKGRMQCSHDFFSSSLTVSFSTEQMTSQA